MITASQTDATEFRLLSRGMRAVFATGAFLVATAGIQLFILPTRTDRWFAWTIQSPLTAAFLGAFYWTAFVLAVQSALQREWVRARVGVMGVFVFVTLTFVLTILHYDKFHFRSADPVARSAAYLWFVIYLVDPILVAAAWFWQLRQAEPDSERVHLVPRRYLIALAVQGIALLAFGVALFVSPNDMSALWPWTLTPLTSRAVAAWLVGLSLVVLQAVWERAWERIEIATSSYVVLSVLQFLAIARFPSALDWGTTNTWLYLVLLSSILLVGMYGWISARRVSGAGNEGIQQVLEPS